MAAKKKFAVGVVLKGSDKASGPVSKGFRKIAGGAKRALRPVARLGKAMTSLKTLAGGLALGFAVRAGARQLMAYADAADDLAKTSRGLKLTVEQLQEWRHASVIAGVESEVLGKAFSKLAKNVGEAKAGQGELITFLGKVSPALLEQVKAATTVDGAMEIVVGAMEKVEDPLKRIALASAFFGGRIGTEMVRFADAGSKAIKSYRIEARDGGLITQEAAEQAEVWADELGRLKLQVGGVKNAIGAKLIPVLTPLLTKAWKWVQANREFLALRVTETLEKIGKGLKKVGIWFDENGAELWAGVKTGAKAVLSVVKLIGENLKTIVPLTIALSGAKYVAGLSVALGATATAAGAVALAFVAIGAAIYGAISNYKEWQELTKSKATNRGLDKSVGAQVERNRTSRGLVSPEDSVVDIVSRRKRPSAVTDEQIAELLGMTSDPDDRSRRGWARISGVRRQANERVGARTQAAAAVGPGPTFTPEMSTTLRSVLEAQKSRSTIDINLNLVNVPPGTTVDPPKSKGVATVALRTVRSAAGHA